MAALLSAVLLASLLGSLHCAGMCGPFVAFYAGSDSSRGARRALSHAAYNGGRLAAYAVLGAALGALGGAVDLAGRLAGVSRLAFAAASVLIVAWGTYGLLAAFRVRLPRLPLPRLPARLAASALAGLERRPPVIRAAVLGLSSALLPCGWLYAWAVVAAGSGTPGGGAAVMATFWLGTLPVMAALGASVQALAGPLRRHVPALAAATLIAVGIFGLVTGVERVAAAPTPAAVAAPAGDLPAPDCPLHRKGV